MSPKKTTTQKSPKSNKQSEVKQVRETLETKMEETLDPFVFVNELLNLTLRMLKTFFKIQKHSFSTWGEI
jgi:hypothetical protein